MDNKRWTIKKQYLIQTILPLIGLGLILTICGYYSFKHALLKQAQSELEHVSQAALLYFDAQFPGEYALVSDNSSGETAYDLKKGDAVITTEYEYVDALKEKTGIDISIYYMDTLILTSITTSDGQRPIGYGCHSTVTEDVLGKCQPHFYQSAVIDKISYYAYYAPIRNSDGTVIGMIFAGKQSEDLSGMLFNAIMPLVIIGILLMAGIGALSTTFGSKFVSDIYKVDKFFAAVSAGNLNATLPNDVIGRKDELGDLARNAQATQKSLKKLIELDGLTELFNRRYSEKRLGQIFKKNEELNSTFCLAIIDIDYFKKVNDTYGHEAGDVVLRGVSGILERHMMGKGYVGRWGGEEFLLVFEHLNLEDSLLVLTRILDEIGESTFLYHTDSIRVTITAGIAERRKGITLNQMLKKADDLLYEGKQAGRNQIVSHQD